MLVLFGDREGLGVLPDGRPWVMLPAPRGTASRHTLNITQLLERVSLRPEPQRDVVPRFGHLDFPVRVIRLGFVFETDGIMGGRTVTFHGFENSAGQSAHKRYEHDLHAGAHRRWRAELALQAGEVDLAEELLGEQDSVATLYLNLAEDAWAAGSRMEVFDLLDSSEAHLRDSSHVARYLGLYERMGDVDEGRVRLEGTILRSLMVFGPASASGVWGGLLDHLVGVDCVRFREVRTWGESRGLASEGVWEEKSATCE